MSQAPIQLVSASTALPGQPIGTHDLAQRFGMSATWEQWVDTFIGTRSRYLAIDLDTGEQRHTLADLGERAARQAIDTAGISAADIDVVVLGTATPDDLMPTTVNVIADRLRIDQIPTFQLQSGCSGAVQTIDVVTSLLATERYRTALVIGGDVIARHYDVTADLSQVPPSELVNFLLFGDGAGAAVLTSEPSFTGVQIRRVFTRLTGLDRAPGQTLRWFGLVDRNSALVPAAEDYQAIADSVPIMAREAALELLDDTGWEAQDVNYILPPQLSTAMTKKIVAELGFPAAKEISAVADVGNNGNALLFFQLEELLIKGTFPSKSLAIAIESSKWVSSGLALEMAGKE